MKQYNLGNGDYLTKEDLKEEVLFRAQRLAENNYYSDSLDFGEAIDEAIEEEWGIEGATEEVWDEIGKQIEEILDRYKRASISPARAYNALKDRGMNEYRDFL